MLILILIVAGVLRLGWPGLTEFKADEARLTTLALEMVEGEKFPIRGISSSVGLANFPMSVWIYGLPLLLWPHVYAATLFTGFLNTAAVLGCYWFVRRYWGAEAALAATLMFAVSPWAVHHSRKIWAQNLLPFFVMGWGISAALALVEQRPKFIIAHLLCLAIAIQVHLAAIALAPATILLLVVFRRRVDWRLVLLGGGLAALTAVPFAYYLFTSGGSIGSMLGATSGPGRGLDGAAFRYAWLLGSGREIHALVGAEALSDYLATVADMTAVHWLWGALMVGGLGMLAWPTWRRPRTRATEAGFLVLVWALAPLLLFTWPRLPVVLHYLLPIYPTPYIAAGVLFATLARRWRGIGWTVLIASAAAQVWVWGKLLVFVATTATPGAFGVPLVMQLEATALAEKMLAEEGAAEVLIAGKGESPDTEAFPAVYSLLLRSAPHRFVDVTRSAVFPATPAIVLLDPGAGWGATLYETAATRRERVPLRAGEGELQLLTLPETAVPTPEFTFDPPHILTNWAAFFGYDSPILHEDGTATWQVYWYAGEPAPVDYHIFNHLLNAGNERISQADSAAFAARQWREGDVVVSHFRLPWPAGTATTLTMRTGMYTYPGLEPILIFDVAGNPYTDAIEIKVR